MLRRDWRRQRQFRRRFSYTLRTMTALTTSKGLAQLNAARHWCRSRGFHVPHAASQVSKRNKPLVRQRRRGSSRFKVGFANQAVLHPPVPKQSFSGIQPMFCVCRGSGTL